MATRFRRDPDKAFALRRLPGVQRAAQQGRVINMFALAICRPKLLAGFTVAFDRGKRLLS
ncbi:MAG: hypothetical protein ACLPNY_12995 [Roseiarcus sp.]